MKAKDVEKIADLKTKITELVEKTSFDENDRRLFEDFKAALRRGEIRSAE
jgi:hypothetical protein